MNLIKSLKDNEIARRYILINGFDGILTILGIVIASFVGGFKEPKLILFPVFGATIAMAISGSFGALFAELAEQKKQLKELEKHLLSSLKNTHLEKRRKFIAVLIALLDGATPLFFSLVLIFPFIFASFKLISIALAYVLFFAFTMISLSFLGFLTAKISKDDYFLHVLRMLGTGFVIGVIFYLLKIGNLF